MAEKEYIEREKAQDGLDNIDWYHVNYKGQLLPGGKSDIETYVPFKAVEEMLKSIPAADVRPVVLCRDCKYAPSGTDDGEDQGFGLEWPHDEWPEDNPCPCKCEDGWYSHKPAPDFFCAAGEKREDS